MKLLLQCLLGRTVSAFQLPWNKGGQRIPFTIYCRNGMERRYLPDAFLHAQCNPDPSETDWRGCIAFQKKQRRVIRARSCMHAVPAARDMRSSRPCASLDRENGSPIGTSRLDESLSTPAFHPLPNTADSGRRARQTGVFDFTFISTRLIWPSSGE